MITHHFTFSYVDEFQFRQNIDIKMHRHTKKLKIPVGFDLGNIIFLLSAQVCREEEKKKKGIESSPFSIVQPVFHGSLLVAFLKRKQENPLELLKAPMAYLSMSMRIPS